MPKTTPSAFINLQLLFCIGLLLETYAEELIYFDLKEEPSYYNVCLKNLPKNGEQITSYSSHSIQ